MAIQSASPSPPATSPVATSRVEGTVTTATADRVSLADGTSFALTQTTRITRQRSITSADLKPGVYVAITARRQPDGTLLASIVSVFAESVRSAVAAGQRPLPEGNLMTNATIDQMTGNTFTVTFPGGGARIVIAPDATLLQQVDATAAEIRAGATISATIANGAALSLVIR